MMTEAKAVAKALGVVFRIQPGTAPRRCRGRRPAQTSMLQDVEQGRTLELQALVGAVIELGRIAGVPTPTIDAIFAITGLLSQTLQSQAGRLRVQCG